VLVARDADTCFALACPVAELDWIDAWHFDLLASDSGRNELDCLFLAGMSGLAVHRAPRSDTFWYTTRYDVERRRFHAVLVTEGIALGYWALEMEQAGPGRARLRWALSYTALTERGHRVLQDPGFDGRVERMLAFLGAAAKHYAETGTILRVPARRKVQLALSALGAIVTR
jgi:hypothetical protein